MRKNIITDVLYYMYLCPSLFIIGKFQNALYFFELLTDEEFIVWTPPWQLPLKFVKEDVLVRKQTINFESLVEKVHLKPLICRCIPIVAILPIFQRAEK